MPDFGFNDWMDAQLRNVPLPPGLLGRLAQSRPGSELEIDARLDETIRRVPVPPGLENRLRRIAGPQWPYRLARPVSIAAAVLLAVGLGIAGLWHYGPREAGPDTATVAQTPESQGALTPAISAPTQENQRTRPAVAPHLRPQVAQTRPVVEEPTGPLNASPVEPTTDEVAVAPTLQEMLERAGSTLGAGGSFDPLPELDAMEVPAPRGVVPPRDRSYDLLFQLKHGEHPFVSPAHQGLAVSQAPFTFRTTSFDLAARGAKAGQSPAADEVRVEDFLAAVEDALPQPPGRGVTLHTAGIASPLGDDGLHFLQLTVQAASTKVKARRPARLVVVVDTSNAMRTSARWEAVQRALGKLSKAMSSEDRLTLIGFAERPRVLVENASGDELRVWLTSAMPPTAGMADLGTAIEAASEAIRETNGAESQKVLFVTAGRCEFNDTAQINSIRALRSLADAHVPWQIVRIGQREDVRLSELARQGHGQSITAASSTEIYAALLGSFLSEPPIAARRVRLKIAFNPQAVTGYRLLGHEAATLTAPAADPVEVDFVADQAATNLYEVWIKPGADQVAVAELTWHDAANDRAHREARTLRRGQLSGSFSQAPPWLQQGVLAAKSAEVLRGSYYLPATRPVSRLLDLAEEVDPRTRQGADFQALHSLLKQAEKSR